MGSLPDSLETLVVSLSNSIPDVNVKMVFDNMRNEENRRKKHGMSPQSHVFVSKK